MRAFLLTAALALLAPLAAAQGAVTPSLDGLAVPSDAFFLIEVDPADLPDGFLETVPGYSSSTSILTSNAPSLGYELPADAIRASEKDETYGLLFSILITGGGHFYAGETEKGLLLLGAGLGGIVAGGVLSAATGNAAPILLGYGVLLGAYIYGIVDGPKAVQRYNAANGFALMPVPVEGGVGLAMRVGL